MTTFIWIAVIIMIAALFAGGSRGKSGKSSGKDNPVRIDRMHLFEADDHECSVCGARFRGEGTVCPKCGARFKGKKDDDTEFIEEMEIWDDDD